MPYCGVVEGREGEGERERSMCSEVKNDCHA